MALLVGTGGPSAVLSHRWAGGGFRYKDSPSYSRERPAQTVLRITGSYLKQFLPRPIKKVRIMMRMFIVYESDHFKKAAISIRKGQDTMLGVRRS